MAMQLLSEAGTRMDESGAHVQEAGTHMSELFVEEGCHEFLFEAINDTQIPTGDN